MARHAIGDARVQPLIKRLVDLVMFQGSVRAAHAAIAGALADSKPSTTIYPNRLHALLSVDDARGVNTATLEMLERAFSRLEIPTSGGERDRLRSEVLQSHGVTMEVAANAPSPEVIRRIAAERGIPPAVVQAVLGEAGLLGPDAGGPPSPSIRGQLVRAPDWTFQDLAVRRCLESLRKGPNRKVGLIVPTGGGKTRIATRIALDWLAASARGQDVVLWVTHRKRLHEQARRELQRTLKASDLASPGEAATLFEQRLRFVMIGELEQQLQQYGERVSIVIVDEAHHAAAPSYQSLFGSQPQRGLFLTATPNRADNLPIGIDDIPFGITYRELFDRRAIVEPVFDEPLTIDGLDWSRPDHLADLADYLLERSESDLRKILVAVSRTEHAERLYDALRDGLDRRVGHVLGGTDVAFVHGAGTSTGVSPLDFLDEFAARPRGILVGTSQLLGEGFDDPAIDAVVITYPSSSISHLMQVAGRALRFAPGKHKAHVIQVHASRLAYHFEQRWLYQDISDSLRPKLNDLSYKSAADLRATVGRLLEEYRVESAVRVRILHELESVSEGERYNLLLTGLPYYGDQVDFAKTAHWSAVLVTPGGRARFLRVFNDFADRAADVNNHRDFLANYLQPDLARGSQWKSYMDMLAAMDYARKEIDKVPYEGENSRKYVSRQGTSWLTYVTLEYRPALPTALSEFLGDVVNRDDLASRYLGEPERWHLAVKVPLPLAGTVAFLLDSSQAGWLAEQRGLLSAHLEGLGPAAAFARIRQWRAELVSSPLPLMLLDEIQHLISELRFGTSTLQLKDEQAM